MPKIRSKEIWISDSYTVSRDELNWIVTPYREKRKFTKPEDKGKKIAGTSSYYSSLENVIKKLFDCYASDIFFDEGIENLKTLVTLSLKKLVLDLNKELIDETR